MRVCLSIATILPMARSANLSLRKRNVSCLVESQQTRQCFHVLHCSREFRRQLVVHGAIAGGMADCLLFCGTQLRVKSDGRNLTLRHNFAEDCNKATHKN